MYSLLARRPLFKASDLESLVDQILNSEPDPLAILRPDLPQVVINIVEKCLSKQIEDRYQSAMQLAEALQRAFGRLRGVEQRIDMQEKWSTLRYLKFFRDFSDDEISEVIDASEWLDFKPGEVILTEGELETAFYIITRGEVEVRKNTVVVGRMQRGDCFGEIAFITHRPRQVTIVAKNEVSLMRVSSSLLEKASTETQLRYYRVFLNGLITRLSSATQQLAKKGEQAPL
jgi:serine/threonine-protein kinase